MRHLSPLLILAILNALAPRVGAEPLRLTIDEAVARATAANLDLSASRKDLDLARANSERSRAWFPANPFLSGGVQHTTQSSGPNYTLLLSQEVEVAGQRGKRVAAALQETEKATAELKNQELTLAAGVKSAFIHALISYDRVALAHTNADRTAEVAQRASARTPSSDIQRIEVNNALIQATRTRRELAGAEQVRDAALSALRQLLGLSADQELELSGTPETSPKDLPPTPELVSRALQQRPDLLALRHAAQRTDLQVDVAQREAIPNVTLTGVYMRFEGDSLAGGDIGVPLPVFQQKTAEIHEAVAERERTAVQLQSLERTIEKEVSDARRACSVAAADLQAQQRDIVPRSEENVRLERRAFERGEVELSDLMGVESDLVTARHEYLDALEAYNTSLIELERVTGGNSPQPPR